MKQALLIALTICGGSAMAQNCYPLIKEGSKMKLDIKSWNTPIVSDPKFLKAKADKQDEIVADFNAKVIAGNMPEAANYPMTYTAKKIGVKNGEEFQFTTNISGKDYSSYSLCSNDTMYQSRNRGPIELPDASGNILGYTIQGAQVLPMHLKVGDRLPTFDDISILFPTSTDITVKKRVFSHNETSTTTGYGYATDSRTGQTGYGEYTKTTTRAVYDMIDVDVRQTLSTSGHSVHYMYAEVTAEDEVTINGTKYKAFVIESENWTKMKMNVSYESADAEVVKQQTDQMNKMQGKFAKMMTRRQFTNDAGYMVMYSKEWFVPGIGITKTITYDMYGAIASVITLAGIE